MNFATVLFVPCLLLVLFALWRSIRWFRIARLIVTTPVSRIADAVPGSIALQGQAQAITPLFAPLDSDAPVAWYELETYLRTGRRWSCLHTATHRFELNDGSGTCTIVAGLAVKEMAFKEKIRQNTRYVQYALQQDERVYAIGQLESYTLSSDALDIEIRLNRTLQSLGEEGILIEMLPVTHVMSKAVGRSLFVISQLEPLMLARRYQKRACAWFAFFVAVCGFYLWLFWKPLHHALSFL